MPTTTRTRANCSISDTGWKNDVGSVDAAPERQTTGRDVLVVVAAIVGVLLFAVIRAGMKV